jgi:hypothetical protein
MSMPAEFADYHPWDFTKFGRGERFVYKRIPQKVRRDVGTGQAMGSRPVHQGTGFRETDRPDRGGLTATSDRQ